MLEKLILKAKEDTPEVNLDAENGIFEISGRSLPEDAYKFYMPILKWFQEYIQNPNFSTILKLKLDYFNSSTARKIVEIIILLESLMLDKKTVMVFWLYKEGDEIMQDRGEEIKRIVKIPFDMQPF